MDFEKLCKVFMMEEPFYGIILSSLKRESVSENITQTIGVCPSGNAFKMVYNKKFIDSLNDDTVLQLLKHECLHLVFHHLWMDNEMGWVTPEQRKRSNVAEDLECNCYLDRNKVGKDAGGMWCEDFGFDRQLGARKYYELLEQQEQQQQAQAQNPQQPCNGGQGGQQNAQQSQQGQQGQQSQGQGQQNTGSGNQNQSSPGGNVSGGGTSDGSRQFDDHSLWPKDPTRADMEALTQQVESLVAFAAEETEKHRGTLPSEIHGMVEKIRKKPKPVADWRKFCRRFMGNEYTYLTKKSRRRESNRFPDAAGTRHQKKSRILVAIDTSGSVSMPEYKEFMGQITTLKEKANFRIIECDARIQNEYEFTGKIHYDLHGGGGTDFQPVVDYFIQHKREFDCLVYFTDGYSEIPRNTPKDTLWVISSQGNQDRKRYRVNGCSSVFIPKKQQ